MHFPAPKNSLLVRQIFEVHFAAAHIADVGIGKKEIRGEPGMLIAQTGLVVGGGEKRVAMDTENAA